MHFNRVNRFIAHGLISDPTTTTKHSPPPEGFGHLTVYYLGPISLGLETTACSAAKALVNNFLVCTTRTEKRGRNSALLHSSRGYLVDPCCRTCASCISLKSPGPLIAAPVLLVNRQLGQSGERHLLGMLANSLGLDLSQLTRRYKMVFWIFEFIFVFSFPIVTSHCRSPSRDT